MAAIQPSPQDTKGKGLFIFARIHAREGQENAVASTLREEVLQARTEPGCFAHNAYQSTRDPRLFLIHSRWIDEAAFDKHAELPHTTSFVERIQRLVDWGLDVSRTVPLQSEANLENASEMKYYAVTRERGLAWNASVGMRQQSRWAEHAAFMNKLDSEGFIVFGGPVGDIGDEDFSRALLVVKADSEATIRKRPEEDPYTQMRMLRTLKIEPWKILLGNDRPSSLT